MGRSNLIGNKYGRLTVLERSGVDKWRKIKWRCRCDCGNECVVISSSLKGGYTKSCGCIVRPHGMHKTKTYKSWHSMKQRCLNPKNTGYKYYGGRGIKICDKWLDFKGFLEDMGERPGGLTLDRINNDGDYCKENCRWATINEQNYNRRMGKNNTSGVTGVHYNKWRDSWTATHRGECLGHTKTFEEACNLRRLAEGGT